MKKLLLAAPLLLAACAPAYTGPKPAPNEVIVESISTLDLGRSLRLPPEREAGVNAFAQISALILTQFRHDIGLPAGYGLFDFPDGSYGTQMISVHS